MNIRRSLKANAGRYTILLTLIVLSLTLIPR
jgi:hypothetical protein